MHSSCDFKILKETNRGQVFNEIRIGSVSGSFSCWGNVVSCSIQQGHKIISYTNESSNNVWVCLGFIFELAIKQA